MIMKYAIIMFIVNVTINVIVYCQDNQSLIDIPSISRPSQEEPLPKVYKVYIEKDLRPVDSSQMFNAHHTNLGQLLSLAIIKKKTPVSIVDDKSSADWTIQTISFDDRFAKQFDGLIRVLDNNTSKILFDYKVNKSYKSSAESFAKEFDKAYLYYGMSCHSYIDGKYDFTTRQSVVNNDTVKMTHELLPTILYKEKAYYPENARKNSIEGTVVLRVLFTSDSRVHIVEVVRGLPQNLSCMAIQAARRIRFIPAKRDGLPVSVLGNLEYTFHLR